MMNKTTLYTVALVAMSFSPVFGQDSEPASSPTPSAAAVPTSTPPSPYSDSNPPPTATPIPLATPSLGQPVINSTTLYRKASKVGILKFNGAEIVLPNIPTPVTRSVSWQYGHVDVIDTETDGSVTTSSWDIHSLTDPYQIGAPTKGGYTNQLGGDDPDAGPSISPDLLPREKPLTVTTTASDGDPVMLGSVFVDDANRIFYTPPKAPVFFALPNDVFEINCVTHLAMNNMIAVEWTKATDDNYHMVEIDLTSSTIVVDFMPEDSLYAQKMLTWIDGNDVLGLLNGRGFERYTTANISQNAVTVAAASKDGNTAKVQGSSVVVYSTSP